MDIELFVHFAEIAGVFVGFGALISLRSAQVFDVHDAVYLRTVLGVGVWVVVVALVPIAVSRYGIDGHTLWLSSAVVALGLWAVFALALNRGADMRSLNSNPEPVDRYFPVVGLPLHLTIAGSLVLIVIGVRRSLDDALYVTAIAAALVFAGYTLLALVLSQQHQLGETGAAHGEDTAAASRKG